MRLSTFNRDYDLLALYSELYKDFRKTAENESDIINGAFYLYLREKGIIGDNDFSMQFNTDGVKLFVSSKYGLWAVLIAINELPYRLRKNNILLCSVWCNKKKPKMNMFLRPFTEELMDLARNGFETTTFTSVSPTIIKVHTLLGPSIQ